MADTRLYELEECVSPQADDILLIEESATGTDKKVTLSNLMSSSAMQTNVDNWLDEHPEATTTVQDGSITLDKLNEEVIAYIDSHSGGVPSGRAGALLTQGAVGISGIKEDIES